MKVKTLLATLAYDIDEVEIYTQNWDLLTRMTPDTLANEYRDMKVLKFWIYGYPDETVLEIVLR